MGGGNRGIKTGREGAEGRKERKIRGKEEGEQ
jgi:hypothetical protein